MRTSLIALSALLASAGAASAQTVKIEDAVARVTVTPEARSDIAVEIVQGSSGLPPLQVRRRGDTTLIDGDLNGRDIRECDTGPGGRSTVEVRGVGRIPLDAAPHIHVRVPMDVDVEADGAVWGNVGRSDTLELSNAGCGDWTIANVRGELEVNLAGSGDIRAGSAGSADVDLAGSGDVWLTSVGQGLDVNIAGSGDVRVGRSNGRLKARIAGSGDVIVDGGRADAVDASIAGSGDVRFAGPAGSVSASIAGSGDVRVASVSGSVSKSIVGSGDVRIGN